MKQFSTGLSGLILALVILVIPGRLQATLAVSGPFTDIKMQLQVDPNLNVIGGPGSTFTEVNLNTTGYPNYIPIAPYTPVPIGTPNSHLIGCSDYVSWAVPGGGPLYPERVIGVSYIGSDSTGLTSGFLMTTIYGIDPNPALGSSQAVAGYNLASPQVSYSGEMILGPGGTTYAASSSEFVSIGSLRALLGPSYDLTPFQSADPNSGVYVFQTSAPGSALVAVPEPSSLALLGGTVILGLRRRRQVAL